MGPMLLDAAHVAEMLNGACLAPATPDAAHPPALGTASTPAIVGQSSTADRRRTFLSYATEPSTEAQPSDAFRARAFCLGDAEEEAKGVESPYIPLAMSRNGKRWDIGQFLLTTQLYQSCRSKLFDATDVQSGERVALKLYRKSQLSALNRAQVEREVNIQINLQHDNIVKLYAAWADERNVYLVQEFADGGDLFRKVQVKGSRCQESVVQEVVACFLGVLQYLHGRGIIHRDIKPENILLTSDGTLKLADFGLAIDLNVERPVTRLGTLEYMAPEVLTNPDKVNPEDNKDNDSMVYNSQVDVWAVGILTYELLVGQAPFESQSYLEVYQSILVDEVVFPPWLSHLAKSFIRAALCKNVRRRPTTWQLLNHPWLDGMPSCRPPAAGMAPMHTAFKTPFAVPVMPAASLPVTAAPLPGPGLPSPGEIEVEPSRLSPTSSEHSRPSPSALLGSPQDAPRPSPPTGSRPAMPPSPLTAAKHAGYATGTGGASSLSPSASRWPLPAELAFAVSVPCVPPAAARLQKALSLPTPAGALPHLGLGAEPPQREQSHGLLQLMDEVLAQAAAAAPQPPCAGTSLKTSASMPRPTATDELPAHLATANASAGSPAQTPVAPSHRQYGLGDRSSAPAPATAPWCAHQPSASVAAADLQVHGLSDDGCPAAVTDTAALPMLSPVKPTPRGLGPLNSKHSAPGPSAKEGSHGRFAFSRSLQLRPHNSVGVPVAAWAPSPDPKVPIDLRTDSSGTRALGAGRVGRADGAGDASKAALRPEQGNSRSRRALDYAGPGLGATRSGDLSTLLDAAGASEGARGGGGRSLQLRANGRPGSNSSSSLGQAQHAGAASDWAQGVRQPPTGPPGGHRAPLSHPQVQLHPPALLRPPGVAPRTHVAVAGMGVRGKAAAGRFESVPERNTAPQPTVRPEVLPVGGMGGPLVRSASEAQTLLYPKSQYS